jgi:flagellar hook-basal body protein
MNNAFNIGVSSSLNHSKGVDIWANNIANTNTTGFKATTPEFGTLFESSLTTALNSPSDSDIGHGVRMSSTTLDLTQGTTQKTDKVFDLALEGEGWFAVSHTNDVNAKEIAYTRNGNFAPDVTGYLVDDSRNYLLGSNFNNIISQNGTFSVDPTKATVTTSNVASQSKLFTPATLNYPYVTSQNSTLNANLYNATPNFIRPADDNVHFESLLSNQGEDLALKNGQSFLFTLGEADVHFENKKIIQEITLIDDTFASQKNVDLLIDGTAINVSWQGPKNKNEIQTLFNNAFTEAGKESAINITASGFSLNATEVLNVKNSDFSLIDTSHHTVFTYDTTRESQNSFTTLGEFEDLSQNAIKSLYGENSVHSYIDENGAWNLTANEKPIYLEYRATDISNEQFLEQLSIFKLPILPHTNVKTLEFASAEQRFNQEIIGADGEPRELNISFNKIATQGDNIRSTWQVDAKITQENLVTGDVDAASIRYKDRDVNLQEGQGFWVTSGEGSIVKSDHGVDYVLKIPSDIADGEAVNISFKINNQTISITAPDGAIDKEIAALLDEAIHNAGFASTHSRSNTLLIHASNFAKSDIAIHEGSTNLHGLSIADSHISKLTYDPSKSEQNSFQTLDEFAALLQKNSTDIDIPLLINISNSQVVLQNQGSRSHHITFFADENSNEDFMAALNTRDHTFSPFEKISSKELSYNKPASLQSSLLSFDTTGKVIDTNTTLNLDNNGVPFELDLSGLSNLNSALFENTFVHDGAIKGELKEYTVNQNGTIIANFTNGKSTSLGEVSVLHFQNDAALEKIGGSLFMQSENSGDAFFYTDNNGDILHNTTIKNRALENSNVELGEALTNLIVLQRAFDGAAKVITTGDELLQNAINMKR